MQDDQRILSNLLNNASERTLWCVDDNIHSLGNIQFKGTAVCNRYDIAKDLEQLKINTLFNNFDFTAIELNFDQAIFRIAKEKAINLHIVSSMMEKLATNGKLLLIGSKNEGIKSLIKKIKDNYQCEIEIDKHKNQLQLITISPSQPQSKRLLDQSYNEPQWIETAELDFFSQYGVFGWNKVDKGSFLLAQALKKISLNLNTEQINRYKILDLGCGYGYLSLKAQKIGFQHIDATDNNAAAVNACQKNFQHAQIDGHVYADDCGRSKRNKYDIVLSNPPFHKGFDHHKDMSEQFIKAIAYKVKDRGNAYIVCNQFIGIEKLASHFFTSITLLDHTDGFKVFALKR